MMFEEPYVGTLWGIGVMLLIVSLIAIPFILRSILNDHQHH